MRWSGNFKNFCACTPGSALRGRFWHIRVLASGHLPVIADAVTGGANDDFTAADGDILELAPARNADQSAYRHGGVPIIELTAAK
jgi:hypothetical protein